MTALDYLQLPYTCILRRINDGSGIYYHASVLEFDGCHSTGDSCQEAYDGLLEAMEGWIETKQANGFPIPRPLDDPRRAQRHEERDDSRVQIEVELPEWLAQQAEQTYLSQVLQDALIAQLGATPPSQQNAP